MRRKLNIRNLISSIIIGEIMVLILGIIGLYDIKYTRILLILFPIVMIALTLIIRIQIYLTEKIKEDALIDTK